MRNAHSTALEDRLIKARQKYQKERNDVLATAEARRGTIAEAITDLRVEDDALAKVEEIARQG